MFTSVTFDGASSDGSAFEVHEFLEDGQIWGPNQSTGSFAGDFPWGRAEGKWWTQKDDQLCIDWPLRVNVVQGCHGVVKSGDRLELVDTAGSAVWWYELPDGSFARSRPPPTESPKISESR